MANVILPRRSSCARQSQFDSPSADSRAASRDSRMLPRRASCVWARIRTLWWP